MTAMLVEDLIEELRHLDPEAPVFIPEVGCGVRELFRICRSEDASADVVMLLAGRLISDQETEAVRNMIEGEYAERRTA